MNDDRMRMLRDAVGLQRAGRPEDAAAICRRTLAAHPDDPDALHILGVLALQQERPHDAVDLMRRAIRARPTFGEAYNNLGVALEARAQLVKAEWSYRAALKLDPQYAEAYNNLGNVLRKQGRPADAAAAYTEAIRLRPVDAMPHTGLGAASLELGRLNEAIGHYRRAAELQPNSAAAGSDLLFWLLHTPYLDPEELFTEHLRWASRFETPLFSTHVQYANDPTPGRVLRVGYISPDFREHTVARFFEPLLAGHDRSAVHAICYSDVAGPDGVTKRLRQAAAGWRDTAAVADEKLAAVIRRDGVDILVDLTGHMGGNRLRLFARKPAPVQVTYMGYPYSTGLCAMDWRISDADSDPPGETERYHTERLMRLSGCAFCYRPTTAPPVTPLPANACGHITFGMLNRMAKVTPNAVQVWARVLGAVPEAHLLVLAPGGEGNTCVRELFEHHGVQRERLSLVPSGPRQRYLRLAERVDIALDPFPYVGMTTTCDFLWMGVPTVTLAGQGALARAGLTLLRAVGLESLVARDFDEYVQIAAALAADREKLSELRLGLRHRVESSPLRDERGLASRIEHAFRQMWIAWCTNQHKTSD